MKKLSTMKRWGVLSYGLSIFLVLITLAGVFFTDKDMSVLGTLTGLSFGETATFTAAYAFKEKSANRMKMAFGFIEKLGDKYGIEAITPILQSVIQD